MSWERRLIPPLPSPPLVGTAKAFEEQCDTALQTVVNILQSSGGGGEQWPGPDGERAAGGKGQGSTPAPRRSQDAGPVGGSIAGREVTAAGGAAGGGAAAEAPSGAEEHHAKDGGEE